MAATMDDNNEHFVGGDDPQNYLPSAATTVNPLIHASSSSSVKDVEMVAGNFSAMDESHHAIDVSKEEEKVAVEINLGPKELLLSPLAWHVASCFITTTVGGMYIAGTFKVFGQSHFSNEGYLSMISSVASIFNSSGRIFWGFIADQIGALKTLIIMSLVFALVLITYPSSVVLGEGGFALWTFLVFFFEGANFVLYVPMTVLLFGHKNSASNYGLIFSSYSLFTVMNIFLLSDAGVPFPKACVMMGLLTGLGFLNLLLLYFHIRYTNKRAVGSECKLG